MSRCEIPSQLGFSDLIGRSGPEFLGTATSHFQAEPVWFDNSGRQIVTSDWEREVERSLNGLPSRIRSCPTLELLPRFLPRAREYIERAWEISGNMFRVSLDFARLCPFPGEFNEELMEKYVGVIARIRSLGMEPMLTFYHWPMPLYLCGFDRNGELKTGARYIFDIPPFSIK